VKSETLFYFFTFKRSSPNSHFSIEGRQVTTQSKPKIFKKTLKSSVRTEEKDRRGSGTHSKGAKSVVEGSKVIKQKDTKSVRIILLCFMLSFLLHLKKPNW
jgi:hypothetical protein